MNRGVWLQLERQRNDNYARANEMRARIQTLWSRLETPEDERQTFFVKYAGYKPSVIEAVSKNIIVLHLNMRCKYRMYECLLLALAEARNLTA